MPKDARTIRPPAFTPPRPAKPVYKPAYGAPVWKKPQAGAKPKDERDDRWDVSVPSVGVSIPKNLPFLGGEIQTPGMSVSTPAYTMSFPKPAWINTAAKAAGRAINTAGNYSNVVSQVMTLPGQIQNRIGGAAVNMLNTPASVYTTIPDQLKFGNGFGYTVPSWLAGKRVGVTNPIPGWVDRAQTAFSLPEDERPTYSPSLPSSTFFSGGSIQDGTREVRTGQNTSTLLGGGGVRNRGTVRIAKGGGVSPVTTPTYSGSGNGGWGTTYKKYGSGGNSYSANTYSSDRAPSWLMNLINWSFKG